MTKSELLCTKCGCGVDNSIFYNVNGGLKDAEGVWICGKCYDGLICRGEVAGRGMEREEFKAMMDLLNMSREELDNVEYKLVKWRCQGKDCMNGTKLRDYGIKPFYYSERKGLGWQDLRRYYWLCGKHNKFYKRLIKNFDHATISEKIMSTDHPLDRLIELNFTKSNKLNE